MSDALISVIIRTINRPLMLKEAIDSVLLQEHQNIEIIIVNDGGPTIENQIGEFYDLDTFTIIENPDSIGRSFAGNQGLENATGDYICFLDDDDIFYPFHLSELLNLLVEKDANVIYGLGLCAEQIVCPFDSRKYMTVGAALEKGASFSRDKLLSNNYIPLNTVLFRSELVADIRFDENLDVLEDWDFWLQLSKETDFLFYPQVTSEYRKRIDNTNTTGQLDHIWWWSREYMQDKHKDLTYTAKRP